MVYFVIATYPLKAGMLLSDFYNYFCVFNKYGCYTQLSREVLETVPHHASLGAYYSYPFVKGLVGYVAVLEFVSCSLKNISGFLRN